MVSGLQIFDYEKNAKQTKNGRI